jgi:hypothetical protein
MLGLNSLGYENRRIAIKKHDRDICSCAKATIVDTITLQWQTHIANVGTLGSVLSV